MYLSWASLSLIILALIISSCSSEAGITIPDPKEITGDEIFVLSMPDVNPENYMRLFEYEQQADPDIEETSSSQPERGITVFDITYASPRVGRVPAYLVVPEGNGPFAGIVLMHGGARSSSREDVLWTGTQYAKYGAVVIIIDAPWNRPEFGPDYVPPRFSPTPHTFTEYDREEQIQLILDLRRAVDLLSARPDVDAERIAYIGISYGGAMGGLLAGIEDRIKAYVLVVGDGGLVTHYSDPYELNIYPIGQFYRMDEEDRQRWLEAMWPIESIHYVDHAAPAALLYQNGTKDSAVPPFDAVRFQEAGSQPKEIIWYESGHELPKRAELDRLIWLQDHIGKDKLIFLTPNYRPSARFLDLLVSAWIFLTIIGVALSLWNWIRYREGFWWVNLIWMFAILIFGPLGLLGYLLSFRKPGAVKIPWRRSLGAGMYSLVAYLFLFLVFLLLTFNDLFGEYASISIILLLVASLLLGLFVFRAPLQVIRLRVNYGQALRQSIIPEVITVNSAITGMLFAAILLLNRWIAPFDMTIRSANFWIFVFITALIGFITSYPFNLWMTRKGFTSWPGIPAVEGRNAAVPSLRKTWAALLLSFLLLVLANGLNYI